MAIEIIKKIKDTESQAADVVKKAHEEAHKMVVDAKVHASQVLHSTRFEADAQSQEIINKIIGDAQCKIKKLNEQTQKQIVELKKQASENMDKAVGFIVESLLKA